MSFAAGQIVLDTDFTTEEASGSAKSIVRLVANAAQASIANNTATAVLFAAEDIDTNGYHSTSTNTSRITPTIAGYYRFTGTVYFGNRTDWTLLISFIRQNGSTNLPAGGRQAPGTTSNFTYGVYCEAIVAMNGSSDYIELMGQGTNTAAATFSFTQGGAFSCTLHSEYLRPL